MKSEKKIQSPDSDSTTHLKTTPQLLLIIDTMQFAAASQPEAKKRPTKPTQETTSINSTLLQTFKPNTAISKAAMEGTFFLAVETTDTCTEFHGKWSTGTDDEPMNFSYTESIDSDVVEITTATDTFELPTTFHGTFDIAVGNTIPDTDLVLSYKVLDNSTTIAIQGAGCNQYGFFEMTGTLHMEGQNGKISLQKVYVEKVGVPNPKRTSNSRVTRGSSSSSSSTASTFVACMNCYIGSNKQEGHKGRHLRKREREIGAKSFASTSAKPGKPKKLGRKKKRRRNEVFNEELQRWETIDRGTGLPEPMYFQPEDLSESATEVSAESVLAALETIVIPKTLRLNTKLHANDQKYGMCLGAIKTYGWGVRASKDCVSRPNFTNLLVRYMKQAKPDFKFTSIQVNKNYLSALHVDSNNMGPSFIVGFGNYVGGAVWQQGSGACDVKNSFVDMDGNIPHATLPFCGTRYTLVYFSHQSWKKASEADQAILKDVYGFPLPPRDQVMANYGNKEDRLRMGKKLFNQFKRSEECPDGFTEEVRSRCATEDYEKRARSLKLKDPEARSRFQHRMNQEWKRLKLQKNARLETVSKFCQSPLWKEMVEATITREELVAMIARLR